MLADAAKRLDVEPSELRDALSDAENAQLDADVKAGRLTQEQADAIKEHREDAGTVLGPDKPFFHHGPEVALRLMPPGGGPIELMESAADALGIGREELAGRLRDGKSLEEIATAEGKSVDDVRKAVEASVKKQLDEAVDDGDLTREQADKMLAGVADMLDDLGPFLAGPKLRGGGPALGFRVVPGGGPIELLDTAADALGISRDELAERLHEGKTLEEIAKAEGKSVADVRNAVRAALKERFDKAVDEGHLTREQADHMLAKLTSLLDDLGRFPLMKPPPPPWR